MPRLLIGVVLGDQIRDHRDHLADIGGGARLMVRAQVAERVHIGVVPGDGLRAALRDQILERAGRTGFFAGKCCRVDPVVHIGEVAGIGDVALPVDMAQQAVEHIENDDGPRIAQMGAVIDCGSADIHRHPARMGGGFQRHDPLAA